MDAGVEAEGFSSLAEGGRRGTAMGQYRLSRHQLPGYHLLLGSQTKNKTKES